jgi:hypothetical protein
MAFINFQPKDYFNTKLYTGDNTSNRGITGVGFQPDWVWNKSRSNAYNHYIFDAVRGAGQRIGSNSTSAEDDKSAEFISFDSDGFTLTNNAGSLNINGSGVTFANWCWKANGAGVSNTDGSITSTVSANTTSGFSISTYTGTGSNATIGHGLGSAPSVVICKQLNATQQWINYHKAIGATKFLHLNATDAAATSSTVWNDTDPTSSVFYVGTAANCNGSGNTYVAYCFAEKKGFSKFGSYTGNASTDGPMIYTGFKPAFIILKGTNAENWIMFDNKRDPINVADDLILPNQNIAAFSATYLDMVSNGFKIRTSAVGGNASGQEFIYMAFAENPLVSSNGVPNTAR